MLRFPTPSSRVSSSSASASCLTRTTQASPQEKLLIIRQIGDNVLGLGPLEPFVRDDDVTEIMVNGWNSIYVERAGKIYWSGAVHDEAQLRRTIDKIVARVGRRVDESSPYVDARLPDGRA